MNITARKLFPRPKPSDQSIVLGLSKGEHLTKEKTMTNNLADLEAQLNHFSLAARTEALHKLLALAEQGKVNLPPAANIANMHCHTFFSFNGYGYSPTALAWLARKQGFKLIGSVDFDVLDAVDEFLTACDTVGVRASTGIETRVYIPEFSDWEINSPGEPRVAYHMGLGFTGSNAPEPGAAILADMGRRAAARNRAVLARVNAHLDPLTLDYERDILPLTPGGNATERHMLAAYLETAARAIPDQVSFWADKLSLPVAQITALMENQSKFANTVRAKLMKRGGVGYVQPGPDTFPSVDEFHRFVEACGALPCAAWLDGTSDGEQAMTELLELLVSKGVVVFNIIPDRNWNIADPAVKQIKLQKLYDVVELAQKLDLPLNVGTEMNAFGQKLVDNFDAPELAPVREAFMDGAYFIYGHTAAQRALGIGYQSDWAKMHLPTRRDRNNFYTRLGKLTEPGQPGLIQLQTLDATALPAEILKAMEARR
jgi:hypothetical protein